MNLCFVLQSFYALNFCVCSVREKSLKERELICEEVLKSSIYSSRSRGRYFLLYYIIFLFMLFFLCWSKWEYYTSVTTVDELIRTL